MGLFIKGDFEWLRQRAREQHSRAARCYLPPSLFALLTLALMVAAGRTVTWPTDGLGWLLAEERILSVMPGGPGDLAGVLPGDKVLAIDGRPLAGVPLYADYRPGQPVTLTLQRGAEIRHATLTLIAPDRSDCLWRLLPVIVALAFWGATLVVFLMRPTASIPRSFFFLGQVACLTLTTGQLSTVNVAWATWLFNLSLCALPPLLVNFYGALSASPLHSRRRWWLPFGVVSFLLAVLYLLQLLLWEWDGWYTVLRLAVRSYLGITVLAVIIGLVCMYITTRSSDLRHRLRGLAFGATLGLTPLLFLSLLPEALWGSGTGLPYQVSFLFLVLIPLSHAYVIVQRDLAPLDRLFNRSLVTFILGLLWAALYLVGVGLGMALFQDTPLVQPLVGALVTVAMAGVFTPLRGWVQHLVDYLFYGGWYDYRSVVIRVSQALGEVTTRQELAERLLSPVVEGLRLRGAALYLRTPEGELSLAGCLGMEMPLTTVFPSQSWERGKEVQGSASEGWMLLLTREDRLLGVLLLGKKREDDFGDPADVEILRTLTEQTALAAENVLLMENLRHALAALEATQQRLLSAREEERRALAWELHDGVVQDLVALNYRLCQCRDQAWSCEPALARMLEEVRLEATRIMHLVRDACTELRSDVLDVMGLGPAIRQYAYDLMQKTGVVVYLDVPRYGPQLADPLGITLFRVFQEALKNAVEHAGGREIWVQFHLEGAKYELRVWDEGQGFVVPERLETLALSGHFGLITMRERMAAIGGHLEVHSAPGKGTTVRVWGEIR